MPHPGVDRPVGSRSIQRILWTFLVGDRVPGTPTSPGETRSGVISRHI